MREHRGARGLARLLPAGARVRLQRDADAPAGARYVFRGGRLVNAAVLRRGLARTGDTGELSKRAGLEAAAQDAQQQRKGIWKSCEPSPPQSPSPSPQPPSGGPEAVTRARADLAGRMFIKITSTSILNSSEARLHLCRDGYAVLDTSWSNDASGGSGVSRIEGSWEVVSAEYTATTASARVRLFNGDGETFRTFFAQGQRVSIDGVDQTQVASSDLCAVRPAAERQCWPCSEPRCSSPAPRPSSSASSTVTRCRCARTPRCARCTWRAWMRRTAGRAGAMRLAARWPGCCRAAHACGCNAMPRRPARVRLSPRPARQRGAAARRRRQARRHRRAPQAPGAAGRGARGRAAAARGLDGVRAAPGVGTGPAAGGQEAIPRARAELADRMFVLKVGTSLWDRSERRLHLCQDGFAGDYWSWVFHSNTGSGRTEGSWEVVSAAVRRPPASACSTPRARRFACSPSREGASRSTASP